MLAASPQPSTRRDARRRCRGTRPLRGNRSHAREPAPSRPARRSRRSRRGRCARAEIRVASTRVSPSTRTPPWASSRRASERLATQPERFQERRHVQDASSRRRRGRSAGTRHARGRLRGGPAACGHRSNASSAAVRRRRAPWYRSTIVRAIRRFSSFGWIDPSARPATTRGVVLGAEVGAQELVLRDQVVGDRTSACRTSRSGGSVERRRSCRATSLILLHAVEPLEQRHREHRPAAPVRRRAGPRGPSSRLNVWSVPPSSTSASTATESYPCSSG